MSIPNDEYPEDQFEKLIEEQSEDWPEEQSEDWSERQAEEPPTARPRKMPLRWSVIVFAFASNLLLTTAGDMLATNFPYRPYARLLATIAGPLLAGILTALYVRERGGMHACVGGLLSAPVLAIFIFNQNWQMAIFAAAFCTLGGALTELTIRDRTD